MKGYKAILQELARTALNYPDGELSELVKKSEEELTDEESTAILEKLKGHYRNIITQINVTNNKAQDEKFKAGQRKKAEEIEKLLKEKFGVDSDKEGPELIEEIQTEVSKKQSPGKDKPLTDDEVKKHPTFIKAETDFKNQLKAEKEAAEKAVNDLKAGYAKKDMFGRISKEALKAFDALNPVLSEDATKAAAQRQIIVDKLEGYEWEEVDGKFIALKDGKRIENEFGHPLEFDELVKQTGSQYFDFRKAEERKAPNGGQGDGGKGGDDKGGTSYKGKLPKTEEEYNSMMNDSNIPLKDRMAINEHWSKQASS